MSSGGPGARGEYTPESQLLGAELRRLRLGQGLTQEQMAEVVIVGGKPVVSMFESGRRLPHVDTIELYASGAGGELVVLNALRDAAVGARPARIAGTPRPPLAPVAPEVEASPGGVNTAVTAPVVEEVAVVSPAPSRRRGRLAVWVPAAVVVLGVATTAVVVATRATPDALAITTPRDAVGAVTSVTGTVSGFEGQDLWLDVQSVTEGFHHTTEQPCLRDGATFSFDPLHVGRVSEDVGVTFRVTVLAVDRGGAGEQALIDYAHRPKDTPTAYDGFADMPAGVRPVATTTVVRR